MPTPFRRLGAVFQKPLHGAVNPKAIGDFGDLAADIPEHRDLDAVTPRRGLLPHRPT